MSTKNVQCLLQDMVEQCALLYLYHSEVQELKSKQKDKEVAMEEIELTMEHSNVNRAVLDIALKIAAIMENNKDDSGALASLLKNLIQNRGTPAKRWSDATKSSFLIMEVQLLPKLCKKKLAAQVFKPCTALRNAIMPFGIN